MQTVLDVFRILQPVVYGGLGVAALTLWARKGGRSAAWLAATFGSLATVLVISLFVPSHSDEPAIDWLRKVEIAVLVLFPYLLYRFTATFRRPSRWLEAVAGVLVLASAGLPFAFSRLPEEDEPTSSAFTAYVVLIAAYWGLMSIVVAFFLWKGGRGQPTAPRRRMRVLSIAALIFAAALVASASSSENDVVQVVVQSAALASAVLFLLGFAPPRLVRLAWRRPEEGLLRESMLKLMEAETPAEVAATLLPPVARLTGGRGAALVGPTGIVGSHGLSADEAAELARTPVAGGTTTVSVPLRSGWLIVRTAPSTLFFGPEELEMLRGLAVLADLALGRVQLLEQERQAREQLQEAQRIAHIGSWEWNTTTNEVSWSDELYRILGLSPNTDVASYKRLMELVHPGDRELIEQAIGDARTSPDPLSFEYRVVRPDGEIRHLAARGHAVLDATGNVVRMVGTGQDVTEQKRQESAREQFIANAAHELRTPLASVLGLIQLLARRREQLTQDQVNEAFATLERSGARIEGLVDSLLDLTSIQQGATPVRLEPFPLRGLIDEMAAAVPRPAGVELKVDVSDQAVALIDPQRLEQIVWNLLANAYKYGGTTVRIEAATHDRHVDVSVSDDGDGVDPGFVPQLFEPFSRSADSSADIAGSGLGLAIAKRLAEAHGGDLWYEPGRPGSRFRLRLVAPR